jgi:hypothetical protein
MPGAITATQISGSLDAKNIVMGLLTHAQDLGGLQVLGQPAMVPELTGTIPVQGSPDADEDLGEYEEGTGAGASSGAFSYVSFDLKKDRVKMLVTDEAKFRSKLGDPLALQKNGAADTLVYKLEKKIINALQTSPQTSATGAIWSTVTNNPLVDLATAVAAIRPYKADFVIMTSAVWAKFCSNNYTAQFVQGNAVRDLGGAITKIPGLNLDVFVSDNAVTAKSCIVGARNAPAFVIGNGPVKVRQYDDPKGGEVYQIDVFRQVKAPILKNASNLNKAVYQLTGVIA